MPPDPLNFVPRTQDTPNREGNAAAAPLHPPAGSIPTGKDTQRSKRTLTRRKFLKRTLLTGGGAGAGALAYGALWEPNHPQVERTTVAIPNLPPAFDGLRVAAISDLHVQPAFSGARLGPALRLLEQERPDLICLLGDYVNYQEADRQAHMEACVAALSVLRAPLGVYACFGNHDYPIPPADPPHGLWEEAGIVPLSDGVAEVERGSERVFIAGLRSMLQRPVTPSDTLGRLPWDATKIVLWHEPDRAALSAMAGAHLMLSGHTHGGQVRFPGFGLKLPAGGRLFPSGLYKINGLLGPMSLYVTRGVGLLPPMVRFNCPPEVTLLTLKRQEAAAPKR